MRFKLQAGREVDVLTKDELQAGLTANTSSWFREMARGLSTARFDDTQTIAGGVVTLPGSGIRSIGPDVGFCWALQRITAAGLDAADSLTVYRNSATPDNRLGVVTLVSNFKPGSKGIILRGDERLIITGTALIATGDITVNGEAIEAAESDLYKLI